MERDWWYTWRPWSSEFSDALGGCDQARLDEYLEAVDGWCAECWDSIHQLVNLLPWECDMLTISLSFHGELADGSQSCREARWKLKLHPGVNSYSWERREDKQFWVDAVLGVSCTRCQLMIMARRETQGWHNFVFCNDGRVVDKKERDGDEDENNVENMSRCQKAGVRLAWLGLEHLVSVEFNTGSGFVPAVSGMVNWLAPEILLDPSLSWSFVPSPLISLLLVLNYTITHQQKVEKVFWAFWALWRIVKVNFAFSRFCRVQLYESYSVILHPQYDGIFKLGIVFQNRYSLVGYIS